VQKKRLNHQAHQGHQAARAKGLVSLNTNRAQRAQEDQSTGHRVFGLAERLGDLGVLGGSIFLQRRTARIGERA
jgi:hypothetical protein